eukprot:CAMPEP_0180635314 /NCGR_PEP_ID=MMETSP1037_2-20121125/42581_1 /TAXON_ID=632150 /ORGANISM="Azadinium spinosum, Strain 3D9" /LENGTH=44 /DNA_ID= /DNA_START= /DNA_END= /DNA_ORIENTATION=
MALCNSSRVLVATSSTSPHYGPVRQLKTIGNHWLCNMMPKTTLV